MDKQHPSVSQAAYKAIESSGSYADAKMAFEMAIADAISQKNAVIIEKYTASTQKAMSCVKHVQKRLGM